MTGEPREIEGSSGNAPVDQGTIATVGEHSGNTSRSSATRQEIEVILARQLAGYLALPILILDPTGSVVFYNEPGEKLLGRRFDEASIPWSEWSTTFEFVDDAGRPIPIERTPA